MQQRRSRIIMGVLSLGLLAGAVLTAGPAQAVDAVGPYYAEPAWDQKLAADTRFVVLTNWGSQAVLDKETGLVWEKSPDSNTFHTWAAARSVCTARRTGGRKGWRLPSVPELASLVDPSVAPGPTLPPSHPFVNILKTSYWSATSDANPTVSAWSVSFLSSSSQVSLGSKTTTAHAWCVRGGMNADAY